MELHSVRSSVWLSLLDVPSVTFIQVAMCVHSLFLFIAELCSFVGFNTVVDSFADGQVPGAIL